MPGWKHYGPLVCGQKEGHDGLHGGPYLWWHDPPFLTVGTIEARGCSI